MLKSSLIPAQAFLDPWNRVDLPKHFSDRIHWIQGSGHIDAWLLLISAGRFRFLADDQVKNDPLLEPLRSLILDGLPTVASEPSVSEDTRRAAFIARLLPIEIAPHGKNWRITFPKTLSLFAPPECDPKDFMILFSPEGALGNLVYERTAEGRRSTVLAAVNKRWDLHKYICVCQAPNR